MFYIDVFCGLCFNIVDLILRVFVGLLWFICCFGFVCTFVCFV